MDSFFILTGEEIPVNLPSREAIALEWRRLPDESDEFVLTNFMWGGDHG